MPSSLMTAGGGLSKSKLRLADAENGNVLINKTFYGGEDKLIRTGTMPDNGAVDYTVAPGSSVTIPAGYHNGNGVVWGTMSGVVISQVQRVGAIPHSNYYYTLTYDFSNCPVYKSVSDANFSTSIPWTTATNGSDSWAEVQSFSYSASDGILTVNVHTMRHSYDDVFYAYIMATLTCP